jgi:alpha-beta hydrolase superfamily lysophospholipase
MAEASMIRVPLLLVHGGADRLAPLVGARAFYAVVGSEDKTLQVYKGLFHETYHEPERGQVLRDVEAWLLRLQGCQEFLHGRL